MTSHCPKTKPTIMLKIPVSRSTGSISTCLFRLRVTAKQEKQKAVIKAKNTPSKPSELTSVTIIAMTPKQAIAMAKNVVRSIRSYITMKASSAVMKGASAMVNVVFATVVLEKANT